MRLCKIKSLVLLPLFFSGISHAQSQLGGFTERQSAQQTISNGTFIDSTGEVGAFLSPDACNNIPGYQGSVPSGYIQSGSDCFAPCVAPASTSSVVTSACSPGYIGSITSVLTTNWSCLSAYSDPVSNTVPSVQNNCILNSPNGFFTVFTRFFWASSPNLPILDFTIKKKNGNYYFSAIGRPTDYPGNLTMLYNGFRLSPPIGEIFTCTGTLEKNCHYYFNGNRNLSVSIYVNSIGEEFVSTFSAEPSSMSIITTGSKKINWCGGVLPDGSIPANNSMRNDSIATIPHFYSRGSQESVSESYYVIWDLSCRN